MSVEAYLTRQLDIRFIDAKHMANEAKHNLGIVGYHGDDQEGLLIEEAIKIFHSHQDEVRNNMRQKKTLLDAVKRPSFLSETSNDSSVSSGTTPDVNEPLTSEMSTNCPTTNSSADTGTIRKESWNMGWTSKKSR